MLLTVRCFMTFRNLEDCIGEKLSGASEFIDGLSRYLFLDSQNRTYYPSRKLAVVLTSLVLQLVLVVKKHGSTGF